MKTYDEEVFGPVASIIQAEDIADAIAIANNNALGLSATIYGDNPAQCKDVALRLE
jgi:acyl-CoA reductase-like NAD-dependent aldehyde dehydrogenase